LEVQYFSLYGDGYSRFAIKTEEEATRKVVVVDMSDMIITGMMDMMTMVGDTTTMDMMMITDDMMITGMMITGMMDMMTMVGDTTTMDMGIIK
jgi:hypothetical protein